MDEEWTGVFDDEDCAPVYLWAYHALVRMLLVHATEAHTKILDLYGIAISQPGAVDGHAFIVRNRLAICLLRDT